jgi:hypothetical protein
LRDLGQKFLIANATGPANSCGDDGRLLLASEKDEYDREVDKAIARDGGTAVLGLVRSSRTLFIGPYRFSEVTKARTAGGHPYFTIVSTIKNCFNDHRNTY